MSTKQKIIAAMKLLASQGSDWSTSKAIADMIPDVTAPDVSKCLGGMIARCQATARSGGCKNGVKKEYKLCTDNIPLERGAVKAFIEENPGLTVNEISERMQCRKQTVVEYVRNAVRDDKVKREKNDAGEWSFTAITRSDLPFGMQNPTRFMFESLLKQARYKENPCN